MPTSFLYNNKTEQYRNINTNILSVYLITYLLFWERVGGWEGRRRGRDRRFIFLFSYFLAVNFFVSEALYYNNKTVA